MGTQLQCLTTCFTFIAIFISMGKIVGPILDVKRLSKRQAKQVGVHELTSYIALPVLFRLVYFSIRNWFDSRLFLNPYL